eukprot:TRINITY_DN204_c0_g1_i15.p2 TRINITY_DN204_c0_g1~~TRINITY_DN204_c0_g1_i15.p2  ORF type:complete len:244 (+),score=17.94 TRINITY_DN204_c0_g1_i15:174-905(+)
MNKLNRTNIWFYQGQQVQGCNRVIICNGTNKRCLQDRHMHPQYEKVGEPKPMTYAVEIKIFCQRISFSQANSHCNIPSFLCQQYNRIIMQAVMISTSAIVVPSKVRSSPTRASSTIVAGLKQDATRFAHVVGLSIASTSLALSASAATIKMGGDDGTLAFVPNSITVKAGEEITWVNNKGFPHNVVFDEDEVPEGVDADTLSNEDYLNAPGETVVRKLTVAGTYGYYCEPHQGAGMKGQIIVQ